MEQELATEELTLDASVNVNLDVNEFDIDLGGIDTSIPLLEKDPKMLLEIKKAEVKVNKAKTGRSLVLFLTNAEPAISSTGVQLPPHEGLISKYFALQANPERLGDDSYNPNRWKTDLAAVIDAVFGTDKENRPRFNLDLVEEMKGRQVVAKVDIEEAEPGSAYGDKNVASGFRYPGK